jgi:hypothetical protein
MNIIFTGNVLNEETFSFYTSPHAKEKPLNCCSQPVVINGSNNDFDFYLYMRV